MKRVCFATPGVYPMLNGIGAYGGSELRAWRLAQSLTARGTCMVSMLAFDYGQPETHISEDVAFVRDSSNVYERGLLPKLRWRIHRFAHRQVIEGSPILHGYEFASWDQVDADVYIAFGATAYSARIARWCQMRGRRFVLMHGSDMDLDPHETEAKATYSYPGLSVAQTAYQAAELSRRFGRDSVVLPNPVEVPEDAPYPEPREFALWVGKSDRIKCPDRMIDLARRCPHVPFLMIMNCADATIFHEVKAAAPVNVSFIDAAPPEAMQSYYRRAFALVSTSSIEGFANSFLEAGACGTPVLSMNVDPEGMLSEHKAGLLSGDSLDAAAAALAELHAVRHWAPGSLARTLGESAYRFVASRHAQEMVFERFASIVTAELDQAV